MLENLSIEQIITSDLSNLDNSKMTLDDLRKIALAINAMDDMCIRMDLQETDDPDFRRDKCFMLWLEVEGIIADSGDVTLLTKYNDEFKIIDGILYIRNRLLGEISIEERDVENPEDPINKWAIDHPEETCNYLVIKDDEDLLREKIDEYFGEDWFHRLLIKTYQNISQK